MQAQTLTSISPSKMSNFGWKFFPQMKHKRGIETFISLSNPKLHSSFTARATSSEDSFVPRNSRKQEKKTGHKVKQRTRMN